MSEKNFKVSSVIRGVGMHLPDKVITNKYFEGYLDTSDEWIADRTGIKERRWAEPGTPISALAEPACKIALKKAGITANEIDGIVFGTSTPDYPFPSSACGLQKRLGIKKGFAFDLSAACSGFIYSLVVADSMIASGQCANVLVVGADMLGQTVDKNDRSTCILFGDGAGAVVLSKATEKDLDSKGRTRGIYCNELCADGTLGDILSIPRGSAAEVTPESLAEGKHFLKMEGREVFKLAVRSMIEVSESVLKKCDMTAEDVDYIVSHQANMRIISAMGKQFNVPESKLLVNVDTCGNTSAASLPILLAESEEKGVIKKGDLVLLNAFGGGLTWGASLVRW
jgi:3-oxoacyl-[acyl-carrier-protein] synthase III